MAADDVIGGRGPGRHMLSVAAVTRWLSSERGLLALVLAVALLHALFEARIRPLYQVPDEISYLRSAQVVALADTPEATQVCIAPLDDELATVGEGGKPGFRRATGLQLRLLCREPQATLPLFVLRALQAASLPFVAWGAWYLCGLLSPRRDARVFAALLVAVHPVAAMMAGAVTPDAWANAFATGAFVAATRMALRRDRWWDPCLLGICVVSGLLWKDTTNAMVALVPLAIVVRLVPRGSVDGAARRFTHVPLIAAVVGFGGLAALFASALRTRYDGPAGALERLLAAPWNTITLVLADAGVHAQGLLASSLVSLYRPLTYLHGGGEQPATPTSVVFVFSLILAVAVAGSVHALARGNSPHRQVRTRVLAIWLPTIVLCGLQPSIRQVFLGSDDLHQGRWLFPLLAPAGALLATGVYEIAAFRRALPLLTMALLGSLGIVVLDVVNHYYRTFPHVLNTGVLFTRPTGDYDIGDEAVLELIARITASQSVVYTWGILVLLSVASLGLAVGVLRRASSSTPHV